MKKFATACAGAALLLCGCVTTHVNVVQLTGNDLIDGPMMMTNGPPADRMLWEYRTAKAAMNAGNFAMAKPLLDDAITRLGGVYGPDKSAQKARSYFHEEREKNFIGEPYERVMAYFYRGIIYWRDGELDNARACFRSGEIEDSSSEGQQFSGDYALLDYLDGLATTKLGGDGSDAFKRSTTEIHFPKPPPYDANANVLVFVDFGPAPEKYADGEYRDRLRFAIRESRVQSAVINLADRTIPADTFDDLGFQARTRGGRVMDYVLENKAVFKEGTDIGGNVAILGGMAALQSRDQTADIVGASLVGAGLIVKGISAAVHPEADVRTWNNLPRYLGFASMQLPPGQHEVTVDFLGAGGQPRMDLTKTITVNVPGDKHDTVVYVSDKSATPQTQ